MHVRPSGPTTARIMIVGEAPGENEEQKGLPFVGASGMELDRMLHEAGILRSECFVTNLVRVRPPGNNIDAFIPKRKKDVLPSFVPVRDKLAHPFVRDGLDLLRKEIAMVQPNLILAIGNASLWALCGKAGVASWRGSVLECDLDLPPGTPRPKVLPTIHPATVLRAWEQRPIVVADLRRAKAEAVSREIVRPDYSFLIRPNFSAVMERLADLRARCAAGPVKLAVDIETRAGHIACVGFAWSKLDALCIPLMCMERPAGYWDLEEEVGIIESLRLLLTHPNCHVIGQNFLYDAQYFYRHLFFIPNLVRDTMLAQHVCFSSMPKGLDFLSSMYAQHHVYWKDEGKEWDAKTGEDQLWTYNCKDAVITFEVDEELQKTVDAVGVRGPHDFQQRLFHPVLETMNRGVRVDLKRRSDFAAELQLELSKRGELLRTVLGHEFNIASPKQMATLFYTDLKQKPNYSKPKPGVKPSLTCNDEALEKIASREPMLRHLIRTIQEMRSLGVFFSTFISAPLDRDQRIRCSFNIGGTVTFRFSSSKNAFGSGLNLQNIPKGGDEEESDLVLPNVRKIFVPDPGHTFFDIDLDSADLRIVVWESDCKGMKDYFAAGLKPYVEVAKEYYHDQTITKHHRSYPAFKSLCHGTNYLGTPQGIAPRIGLLVHEVDRIQKWYFGRFPEIRKWQDDLKAQVTGRRWIQNVFGYKNYIFSRVEGNVFNEAVAWIPQSTVGCLINRGYMNIYENFRDAQVLLQVHDSLAGQFPTHLGDWAVRRIVEECQVPLPYPEPLVIPVGVKTSTESWGGCE